MTTVTNTSWDRNIQGHRVLALVFYPLWRFVFLTKMHRLVPGSAIRSRSKGVLTFLFILEFLSLTPMATRSATERDEKCLCLSCALLAVPSSDGTALWPGGS